MKIYKEEFLSKLNILKTVQNTNSVMASLKCISFEESSIRMTNMLVDIKIEYATSVTGLVDFNMLYTLVNSLKVSSFELINGEHKVSIITNQGDYHIAKMSTEEVFPILEIENEATEVNLNLTKFNYKYAANFLTKDNMRPAMEGFGIYYNAVTTTLVATDAHKLVIIGEQIFKENNIIIPRVIGLISDFLKESPYTTKVSKTHLYIFQNEILYKIRLIEAQFPNVAGVLPSSSETKFSVTGSDLFTGLNRLKAATKALNAKVKITKGCLYLEASNVDFNYEAKEQVRCEATDEYEFGIVVDNFLKILSGFPGVITFAYNGPTRPIVIENGSYYVLSTLSLINESEPVAKVKKVKAGAKKEEEAEQEESEEENEDEVVEQYNAED